jgi:riboflavin kinase/FMN adenylyltransferase
MAIFYQTNKLPKFRKPVITIGSFDGVHHGHKAILSEVMKAAQDIDGESILITFEPHPRKIIQPDQPLGLLTAPDKKYELIMAEGIDHIVVVPFTRDFSMLSAQEYVQDFLLKNFEPAAIIIGYDHHFGHSREGDINLLRNLVGHNIVVHEIPAQLIDDAAVSSTKIRNALLKGNVTEAAEMLDRPFSFTGLVVHGNKLGRTIGYPTANLSPVYSDLLIPGIGIYAVVVRFENKNYKGMMSIGYRPTVSEDKKIAIEVNIFDFSKDIYGQNIEVYCIKYLRNEEKFDSLASLKNQIAADEIEAKRLLM